MPRVSKQVKFDRKAKILGYAVEVFKTLPRYKDSEEIQVASIKEIYNYMMDIITCENKGGDNGS